MAAGQSQVSIKVEIIEGRNLLAADAGGTSDPYVRVKLNGDQRLAKTKVIKKTLNPYWNETYVFPLQKRDPTVFLKFECWDEDAFTDDALGYFVVYLNDLQHYLRVSMAGSLHLSLLDNYPNQPREQWYKLDHVSTGEIRLVLTLVVDGAPLAAAAAPIAEASKTVKTVTGEVRLQGWLFKYNTRRKLRRRRYFVLAGGTLTWSAKPNDMTPLNKIALGAVKVMPTGSTDLLLSGTKAGKSKDWVLSGQTPEEAKMWVEALIDSQKSTKHQLGWLVRDKKKHFYLLQHSVLYWFDKEIDPAADFKKDVKGAIKLYLYVVKEQPTAEPQFDVIDYLPSAYPEEEKSTSDRKGSSIIQMATTKRGATFDDLGDVTCSLTRRSWTFKASTKEELKDWLEAFHDDIRKHKKRAESGTECLGWLKPKGGKKSFCILARGRFLSAEDTSEAEKGTIVLDECAVRKDLATTLTIYSPANPNIVHTFLADKESETDAWIAALQTAIASITQKVNELADEAVNAKAKVDMSGWLILKGKRKYFGKLKGDMLLLYENEPQESLARTRIEAKLASSIRLKDAHITRQDFTFTIRATDGQTYVLGSQSKHDIAEWIVSIQAALQQLRGIAYAQAKGTAIDPKLMAAYKADLSRQGWVMREKKKRMLELAVGRLSELDAQLKPKLIIPLENASITQVDSLSFLVRTSAYSHLYNCAKNDTTEWVKNISFYIIKANAAAAAASELDKSGWLIVNGKPSWCGLKLGKFSWFPSEQRSTYQFPDRDTASVVDNKFAAVPNPSKKKSKNFTFTINPVEIRADCEATATDWLGAFQSAVESEAKKKNAAFSSANAAPVFGVPLRDVLAADKKLKRIGEGDTLPYVVMQCLAVLETDEAMSTKDLWKANTAFSKAREWANQLNSGQKLNLASAQPKEVAGLLKYFLKSLPEPLIVTDVQPVILDHRMEAAVISGALGRMPPSNMILLTRLIQHLDQLTVFLLEAEDVNAVDLAMAFAPLFFRIETGKGGDGSDTEASASETDEMEQMMAVLATGTMIANYFEIFVSLDVNEIRIADLALTRVTEGKAPTVAQSLGVAKEDTKVVQEALKSDNLDALLKQFATGDTQGLSEQQVLAITQKKKVSNAVQRDQLKVKEKFIGGATVKRVDDAVDDLDDLMGDLNASRFGDPAFNKQKQLTPAPKFSGGATTKRVDDAVSDLDDLMGDMGKSRASRRQTALAESMRPKILGASMMANNMMASHQGRPTVPSIRVSDEQLSYLMQDSIAQRKAQPAAGKLKPGVKFSGGTTVQRVNDAVTDLDDLLDDMFASKKIRTQAQDDLLDELEFQRQASVAIKRNKADARSMMTALKTSVRPNLGASGSQVGSVSMAFADYEASKPAADRRGGPMAVSAVSAAFADFDLSKSGSAPQAPNSGRGGAMGLSAVSAAFADYDSANPSGSLSTSVEPQRPAARTDSVRSSNSLDVPMHGHRPTSPGKLDAPRRPASNAPLSTSTPNRPGGSSGAGDQPPPRPAERAPDRPVLAHHSTVTGLPAPAPAQTPSPPPLQHASSYHHPPPSNLAQSYYAPDLGASYHAPAPQHNLAQSYQYQPAAPVAPPPANLGQSYHAAPPLQQQTSYYAPDLGASYHAAPANLSQSYHGQPAPYAAPVASYSAPADLSQSYHPSASPLAQSYHGQPSPLPPQQQNLSSSYYHSPAPQPAYPPQQPAYPAYQYDPNAQQPYQYGQQQPPYGQQQYPPPGY